MHCAGNMSCAIIVVDYGNRISTTDCLCAFLCQYLGQQGGKLAGGTCAFVVFGGILYYVAMTVILWLKMDPNDLKLFTAMIVAVFLAVPYLKNQTQTSFSRAGRRAVSSRKGAE